MSLATSTSAKALQRPAADKAVYLFDGSLLTAYWTGSAGQVAQVTSPLSSPSVTSLFTTSEDGVSLWADNSSGTSSDIWVASSFDDASGSGPGIHVRHGTYNGSSFSWDTSTAVPGSTQAATIQCTVTWNGTYLMVFWWDGASGTDRVAYNWTTDKTGQAGWLAASYAPVFSESASWSTVSQVTARHSAKLGAVIVVYSGNSAMHYACLPDSAGSGPKTGATLSATSTWSGTTTSSASAGVIAAVKPSGTAPVTPVGASSLVQATSGSITSAWGTGQNRTAGNLLVAVVSATGTTSAATIPAPSGWTRQLTAGGATPATTALFTKTAAGSDAAPAFTSTISGTATMDVTLLELAGASTSAPVDASGAVTASTSGMTVTTSGNIATSGDFAVAGFTRERAATTAAYTPAIGWANLVNDGATSSTGHFAVDVRGGPDITRWGGRATYDSFTDSYGFGGPALVVDESSGSIHCVKASPNAGGPTWTGVVYWLGTYNGAATNTVTWGTRVAVDSTATTTGPPEVTAAVDVNGTVYAVWVTDQSADSMKYSTLASPYTSATAGGTFSTGGSTPRYPHCPPVSASMGGLSGKLPVLFMDSTSTPFPVSLDTSVTLPGGTVSGAASLSGSGSLAAAVTVTAGLSLSGSGSLSAAAQVAAPAGLSGAGSLTSPAAVAAPASLSGSGSLASAPAVTAPASLSGTGTLAAGAVITAAASLSGSGSLAATVTVTAGLSLSGSGTVSAAAQVAAPAGLSGAGSLTSPAAVTAPAALAGSGSLSAGAAVTVPGAASLSGSGTLAAAAAVTGPASLSGSGSLAAALLVTVPGTASLSGSGSVTAAAAVTTPASLSGSGSLTASQSGSVTGTASLSGTGALAAAGAVASPAALSGSGSLLAAATVTVTAAGVLSGSGSLAAAAVLVLQAAVPLSGLGTLTAAAAVVIPVTGPAVTWAARPAPPRWQAGPALPRWQARPGSPRWQAEPAPARWHVIPASPRWRIIMANFAPIAAVSLEEVNVTWTSELAGTSVDPTGATTGQPALTVQMAFPVSSGNPAEPASPVTWYAASWLLGGTSAGYIAQALVGPGGGVVTLTAGLSYDVHSKVSGSPESPVKFAGTLPVY